jgi:DNA-binding transcriptional MerR regulator
MDQLVKAANQRISELKIRPSHHKAQSELTSRTVRYYLQNGYIPEAIRMSGQIRFTEDHVKAIVKLKSLQADGLFLRDTIQQNLVKNHSNDSINKNLLFSKFDMNNNQGLKWTLKVSEDISLVGTGPRPTADDFAMVKPLIQLWHENHLLRKSKR